MSGRRVTKKRIRIPAGEDTVSALWQKPAAPEALIVLAHGAGAGMEHAFMETMATRLVQRDMAVLRFQFPYMEKGRRAPDRAPRLLLTWSAALDKATGLAGDLPLYMAGKSMGGRMASLWLADHPDADVAGVMYLGYPLHPPGKPGTARGDHLSRIACPQLFMQGTRDKLATIPLIRRVCDGLPGATLHIVEEGDHSFQVTKRSGQDQEEIFDRLADVMAGF